MQQYSVTRTEAQNFARVWNKGGISIPMQDVHIDFATAFANVVLRNFITMCQQQVQARMAQPKQTAVEGTADQTTPPPAQQSSAGIVLTD